LCCWFTSPNDIGRIQRGLGTDLSWEELELLVKGITGESFILESLMLPQDIPALCDDPGMRTAVLASLPTLDESGVAVHQTGGRDPLHGIWIPGVPAGGPQPAGPAPNVGPVVAPNPLDKGKGATSGASAPGSSEGSEEERRRRLRRADGSFISDPPRSVSGLLVGPRKPAPRPRARRGASVRRQHHHRVRRHHNHRRHWSCRRHHHLGMISPRGTSSSNNNSSSNSKSIGRPTSRVAGRFRAPSEWSPFLLISIFIMPTGFNPSFVCQGFLPLCSQGRASSAPDCCRRDSATGLPCSSWGSGSSGANAKRRRSGGGGPNCSDGYHSLNDGDAVEYTVGSGRRGPNCARPRH
jgi:hypothetical protein